MAVPDPHRGTKGTCLGPRASGGPAGSSSSAFRYWKKRGEEVAKRKTGGGEDEGEKEMKIRIKSQKGMEEKSWADNLSTKGRGLPKRGKGPAPCMCLGPRDMGIRPW